MDSTVVIDCMGSQLLTISIDGALHSVPIGSNVIRINKSGTSMDYEIDKLPLRYNLSDLQGRLNICDSSGRLIYCWRSIIQYPRRSRSPSPRRDSVIRSRSPRSHLVQQKRNSPDLTISIPSPGYGIGRRTTFDDDDTDNTTIGILL